VFSEGYIPLHGPGRTRTDPHRPALILSETRTDPTEFLGDPGRKKVRAGPVGSGPVGSDRTRVVEFSYNQFSISFPIMSCSLLKVTSDKTPIWSRVLALALILSTAFYLLKQVALSFVGTSCRMITAHTTMSVV